MLFGGSRASVGGGRGVKEEADDGDGATVASGTKPMRQSLAGSDTYGRAFKAPFYPKSRAKLPTGSPRRTNCRYSPSPLVRRHVIAEIDLPSLLFMQTVIPKLKAAAFLKVKLTNTSNVPLLPTEAS